MFSAKYDAIDVAEYVLWYCEKVLDKPITNLKLQKILYYIQGEYLAKYKEPLFDNDIEAWAYGPVVPDVYYEYKKYISGPIKGVNPLNKDLFTKKEKSLIRSIVKRNYTKNVWSLVQETHQESPWKNNYEKGFNNDISIVDMEEYFGV